MIPNTARPDRFNPQPKKGRPEPKTPKPISRMSEKKKQEVKEGKGQWEMFLKIWGERPHRCVKCNERIATPEPGNFDHIKPKSTYPELRLDPANIQILCFDCHYSKHNKV